ncbi:MAG TPA: MFS transporter [Acidobacteriaceae bacterium]|jgi:fucose permease|nr:MFS transporter [Acidobacteriaceae bacterium]
MTRSRYMVVVVFAIFFVMSFITNILGPLIPDIIQSFHLSYVAAALLPFSFFIAYGVLSIPSGFLVEKWGEKPVILGFFILALIGSLLFAWIHDYSIAIGSLFLIGCSMAGLQVAINPLLRVAGGEEHFAFNSAFAQLIFGSASFISPMIYSWIVRNLDGPASGNPILRVLARTVPSSMQWIAMYWIFAVVIVAITLVLAASRFPKVVRNEGESSGTLGMYRSLLGRPVVWLYFFSVFFYVGSEQGTANWISEFLSHYHGFDPHTTGATAVAWFWGLLTLGCFIGMILLKLFDSRVILRVFGFGALLCLSGALFGPAAMSKFCFPCVGLFASVMWPIIISLALNSILEYQGPLAGIFCSGIMGGAILPLVIGRVADAAGLRTGMCLLYVSFGWVLAVSFWAKPLITNQTLSRKGSLAEV